MKKIIYLFLITCVLSFRVVAQAYTLDSPGNAVIIDFEAADGSGFAHPAATGQLDSENWSIVGFSDAILDFQGVATSADFTGTSIGGETAAGVYIFTDAVGNKKMMVQATGNEFTPGNITTRIQNNTGLELYGLHFEYDLSVYNDYNRSNSWNISYSTDNENFTSLSQFDYASPELGDSLYYNSHFIVDLFNINLADEEYIYLRFDTDDLTGSGNRDEFSIDNLSFTGMLAPENPTINFSLAQTTVNEANGSVSVDLNISEAADCTVDIAVSPLSTASDVDYSVPSATSFTVASGTSNSFDVIIEDDSADEPDETLVLTISSSDCEIGPANTININIGDNDAPAGAVYYPIGEATLEDANGVALNIGELVELHGVVHGVNLRPTGLEFTLIDETGGINAYNFNNNLGYSVQEGDQLIVIGQITQYFGLTQVILDAVTLVSANNPLTTATLVTELSEETESQLVSLENVQIVNLSQWNPVGSGFNVTVSDGTNNYEVRIDQDTELYSSPAPEGLLSITGIGSQFDATDPYTEGYNIMPRYAADIIQQNVPILSFANPAMSISEGDTFGALPINVQISEAADCEVNVVLSNQSTASATDFTYSPTNLSFTSAGSPSMVSTFNVLGDEDGEGNETAIFNLEVVSGDCVIGNNNTVTITILDDDEIVVNVISIAEASANAADLTPSLIGQTVTVSGIVHGVNINTNGLAFTIIDETGGIAVYSATNTTNYTVTEGDQITATGSIGQFNGLTQIITTSFSVDSQGNPIETPTIVTAINEDTESELIKIASVWIPDPSQWTGTGSGFNVNVTDGTNTYAMRIDNDVDLYSMPAPTGTFDLIGIGGQFDNSAPYDSGYQIFPRYQEDIIHLTGIDEISSSFNVFPNPIQNQFSIAIGEPILAIQLYDLSGRLVKNIQANSSNMFSIESLPMGIYVLEVLTASGNYRQKVSKI